MNMYSLCIINIHLILPTRKAKKEYDKYCAPLLHLSGAKVTLLNTTDEHNATTLGKVGITEDIDALIVAGGDGTISEVVRSII